MTEHEGGTSLEGVHEQRGHEQGMHEQGVDEQGVHEHQKAVTKSVERRRLPLVGLVALTVALLAWIALITQTYPIPGTQVSTGTAGTMPGMNGQVVGVDVQMSDPGAPEAMALAEGIQGVAPYLAMWGIMMTAMMYPAAVKPFQTYVDRLENGSSIGRILEIAIVVSIYTLVWALVGIFPLLFNTVVPIATLDSVGTQSLLGGTLVVLSAFQLSGFKRRWLFRCRSPVVSKTVSRRRGVRNAIRSGWRYSKMDLGSCWALMALLVVLGSMNLSVMAGITALIIIEHTERWGFAIARVGGGVAGVAGIAILVAVLV